MGNYLHKEQCEPVSLLQPERKSVEGSCCMVKNGISYQPSIEVDESSLTTVNSKVKILFVLRTNEAISWPDH